MLYSLAKREDLHGRSFMLECMEILLRLGRTEDAKAIGVSSAKLKQRLDTHDYSKEERWEKIINRTV